MAYDRDEIYTKALKIASEKNVYFIEDIIASIPISKPTFYEFFPPDSNELNAIKAKIDTNKILTKKKLRKRWDSDTSAPVLQIALYKLIADDEEGNKINSQYIKADVSGLQTKIKTVYDAIQSEPDIPGEAKE